MIGLKSGVLQSEGGGDSSSMAKFARKVVKKAAGVSYSRCGCTCVKLTCRGFEAGDLVAYRTWPIRILKPWDR